MRKVYRKVARKYGVTVEEVKREMQSAIDETYNNSDNNDITKAYQNKVPREGKIPTVDEFIRYASNKAKNK
jgi:hypothetical protein